MSNALELYSSTEPEHLNKIRETITLHKYTVAAELGTHIGGSIMHIAVALQMNGGGRIYAVDNVQKMLDETAKNFRTFRKEFPDVALTTYCSDLPFGISLLPNDLQFVFIDDFHNAEHVSNELGLLLPKMATAGTIAVHDTKNPVGIGDVFVSNGGTLFNEGHGLGIIQVEEPLS